MTSLAKTVTWIFGVVLLAVGIYGYIENPIFGLFQVDSIHNIIHILSGVVAMAAAFSGSQAYCRLYLIVFGLVYGLVTVVGFVNGGNILGVFAVNQADNFLHLAIAVVTLYVGFTAKK